MSDSYIQQHDPETQQPKKIKIYDNGDGTYSFSHGIVAGEAVLGKVGGITNRVSAEMTRATDTTSYDIGDIVLPAAGGVVTLSNVARVLGGSGYITGIRLTTNKKSITPRFRIHFFKASNPTLSADNAAWQDKYADIDKRVGYWDMPPMTTGTDTTNSDMSRTLDYSMRIPFKCADDTKDLYFALEALDAFAPANGEKFSVVIHAENN